MGPRARCPHHEGLAGRPAGRPEDAAPLACSTPPPGTAPQLSPATKRCPRHDSSRPARNQEPGGYKGPTMPPEGVAGASGRPVPACLAGAGPGRGARVPRGRGAQGEPLRRSPVPGPRSARPALAAEAGPGRVRRFGGGGGSPRQRGAGAGARPGAGRGSPGRRWTRAPVARCPGVAGRSPAAPRPPGPCQRRQGAAMAGLRRAPAAAAVEAALPAWAAARPRGTLPPPLLPPAAAGGPVAAPPLLGRPRKSLFARPVLR